MFSPVLGAHINDTEFRYHDCVERHFDAQREMDDVRRKRKDGYPAGCVTGDRFLSHAAV